MSSRKCCNAASLWSNVLIHDEQTQDPNDHKQHDNSKGLPNHNIYSQAKHKYMFKFDFNGF